MDGEFVQIAPSRHAVGVRAFNQYALRQPLLEQLVDERACAS
jgi:hypothetical protein